MLFSFCFCVFKLCHPDPSAKSGSGARSHGPVTDEPKDLPLRVCQLFDQKHDHRVGRTIEGNVAFEDSGIAFLVF